MGEGGTVVVGRDCGVSTKLYFNFIFSMQTYKEFSFLFHKVKRNA